MPDLERNVHIYWFEQSSADVLEDNAWLSAAECDKLNGFRVAKRRADWRLGRWTAKCAVAAVLQLEFDPMVLREFELRPLPGGAPRIYRSGSEIPMGISLSHRDHRAACAIAPTDSAVGCDLEILEQRSDGFIADYFSVPERPLLEAAIEPTRSLLANLFWSAKESALKAMGIGLTVDTRDLTVTIDPTPSAAFAESQWLPFQVSCSTGTTLAGRFQRESSLLRTVAASSCASPIQVCSLSKAL